MILRWNDLDVSIQKSVFSAISILCILLCISLFSWIHYVLIGLTALASGYMAYLLFLKPLLAKKSQEKTEKKAEMKAFSDKYDDLFGFKE